MNRLLHAVPLIAVLTAPVWAQPPAARPIRGDRAEIRGGPSDIFPITGTLTKNQTVTVLPDETGDYCAIAPPPGSSSWIMDRFLIHDTTPSQGKQTFATVNADNVPVRLGTPDRNGPYPLVTATVMRGTLVQLLGEKATADNTLWWRISPVPSEKRYLLKSVLDASTTTVASKPTTAHAPPGPWGQAEQAEREGRTADAVALYTQVARAESVAGGDHDLAIRAWNRVESLQRRPTAQLVARPANSPAALGAPPPAAPVTTSALNYRSGPGVLRRCAFQLDGQPAYVLEDVQGHPRLYMTSQAGLNLEPYLNRNLELFGTLVQRTDLSNGCYMVANRVYLLR